ncbi:MAG: hypothetical protein J6Y76_01855 [Paludibacteraceae bacterium]|jgi:hypothetical protein|nr:hypothetical protein [Paludibacteraceae bacterium]
MEQEREHISMQDVLNGNIFTKQRVRRHYKLLLLIFVLLIVYIFEGYQSQRQQARIVELNRALQDAHYEYLTINAELTEMSRQSIVSKRLKDAGSNVKESTTPAVSIK